VTKEDEDDAHGWKLARAARVGVETIRFYERRGLVEPATRLPSGYRIYAETQFRALDSSARRNGLGSR
jgi:DNA-binding transcriptional MerR regulator